MFSDDHQDRTEQPTARRLREAHEQGNAPQSNTLTAVIQLFVAAAALYFFGWKFAESAAVFLHHSLSAVGANDISNDVAINFLSDSIEWCGSICVPFFGTLIAFLVVSNLAQTGFRIVIGGVIPNWERISPFRGFERLASLRNFSMLGTVSASAAVCAGVTFFFAMSNLDRVAAMSNMSPSELVFHTTRLMGELLLWISLLLLALASFDFLFQRWNHRRQLMMTKQEVREELKTAEVDPQIQRQLVSARQRMRHRTDDD